LIVRLSRLRIDRGWSGGSLASAKTVGADYVEPGCVDWFPRTYHVIPPTGLGVAFMVSGAVMIATKGVADEDGVGMVFIQFPIGFITNVELLDDLAVIELERLLMLVIAWSYKTHIVDGLPRLLVCLVDRHVNQ